MSVLTTEQLETIKKTQDLFGSRESAALRKEICIEKIRKGIESGLQPEWHGIDTNSGDYIKLQYEHSTDQPKQGDDLLFIAPHNSTKEEVELLATELHEVVENLCGVAYVFDEDNRVFGITTKHPRFIQICAKLKTN